MTEDMAREPLPDRVRDALEALAIRARVAGRLEPPAVDALLRSVVEAAAQLFDAQASSIALHEPETDRLVFRFTGGAAGQSAEGLSIRSDEGIAGYVFRTGQPLAVADVAADPRFGRKAAESSGYVPRSILAVPLVDDADPIGVLEVLDRRDGEPFGLRDLELAGVFARQATIAIRATRVERGVATLVGGVLARLADGQDTASALAAVTESLGGDTEDGFWALVDVVARIRAADPDQVALVRDLLEVLARRTAGRRQVGWRGR
ncbi:MAG TPA: GAF domain-containing protein [Candidatus Limnocylindrales bacterium]|nr:GAF domain-containing protein [Candidatus Limnocylindrales bacterium]